MINANFYLCIVHVTLENEMKEQKLLGNPRPTPMVILRHSCLELLSSTSVHRLTNGYLARRNLDSYLSRVWQERHLSC